MSAYIQNAAPMVLDRGTQDLSKTQPRRVAEAVAQHVPKFFIYAQKGPTTPQLVVGAERTNMFGETSFDIRSKYANHATVFANAVNTEGNACMYQRVIPEDAGPLANILLWLDVLPTMVDDYKRSDTDGSIILDTNGDPIVLGQVTGYKVKWVASYRATEAEVENFGKAAVMQGSQTDKVTGVQSQRYPILELKGTHFGDYGNLCGIRLWAPTTADTNGLPTTMMAQERAYPFFVSSIRKADANSSAKQVETIMGAQRITVTFKPGVIDPDTDKQLFLGDMFLDSYQNLTDTRYPVVYGDFQSMALYNNNVAALVKLFHAAEAPFIDNYSDFTTSEDDAFLFNFVGGTTSGNVAYHSFQFVDDANSIRLTEYTNLMAKGGADGTMTNAAFAKLVEAEMARYLDANDELMEDAYHVESIMYDSGFPLKTKYSLCSFIAQRHDTFVWLSTYDVDGNLRDASEEHSLAVALRTRLQMYPESDYFGTPVMRGGIMGYSARVRNSQYTGRLPLTYEVAVKSARYMGAGIGAWTNGQHFDGAPGSVLDYMYDVSIPWVPASVRNRNWDVGLNWVQRYDRSAFFFPALKTVYNDDTSVLNSYFTAMAIGQLNKVAHKCWREFSGVAHLTNAQLIERVNAFIAAAVKDRFDGRYVIVPDAQVTDDDVTRGFSFTLPIKLYSANMKSVCTTYVQAYRLDDLTTSS